MASLHINFLSFCYVSIANDAPSIYLISTKYDRPTAIGPITGEKIITISHDQVY